MEKFAVLATFGESRENGSSYRNQGGIWAVSNCSKVAPSSKLFSSPKGWKKVLKSFPKFEEKLWQTFESWKNQK